MRTTTTTISILATGLLGAALGACGEGADSPDGASAAHVHEPDCLFELHELSEDDGGGRIEVWRCDPTALLPAAPADAEPWFDAWRSPEVVPVEGLDPLLADAVARGAPAAALRLDATIEIETPRAPNQPVVHQRVRGVVAADGRFSVVVSEPLRDDRGVDTVYEAEQLFDGATFVNGDRSARYYSVFHAESRHMPEMLERGNDVEPLVHWVRGPMQLHRLNHADVVRTEEQSARGERRVRFTRDSGRVSDGRAWIRHGYLFGIQRGAYPIGAYTMSPEGTLREEHRFVDNLPVTAELWRPMIWEWRRFERPGDQPTLITRVHVHHAEPVTEPLDEVFALATLPAEYWDITFD